MTGLTKHLPAIIHSTILKRLGAAIPVLAALYVLIGPVSFDHEREALGQALRQEASQRAAEINADLERERAQAASERLVQSRTTNLIYYTLWIQMLELELKQLTARWEATTDSKLIDHLSDLMDSTRTALLDARRARTAYVAEYHPPIGVPGAQ